MSPPNSSLRDLVIRYHPVKSIIHTLAATILLSDMVASHLFIGRFQL